MSPDRPHSLRCKKVSTFTLLNPEGCPELRNLSLILCEPAGGYFQPKKNLNPADHAFGNLNGMRLDAFGGPGWSATCAVGGVSTVFPSLKEFDMRTLDDSRAPHFSVYNEMLKFSVFPKLETLNNKGEFPMILYINGVYGEKNQSLCRLSERYRHLPFSLRSMCWGVQENAEEAGHSSGPLEHQ